jgi:predicted AAA+ superfamily ATPase
MILRNSRRLALELAAQYPVVSVVGPRQSGKTTLCRDAFASHAYVSLEAPDTQQFALQDPRGLLGSLRDGAVLDEVQNAPDLLRYLQEEVDERPEPGRFVLTGSEHFALSERVSQSLAGRVGMLTLLPCSYDEVQRFEGAPSGLWDCVWRGGYPRIHDRRIVATRWLADYVTTYVQRDVRQVVNVGDLHAFTTFVRLVAGRTATELNLSALGADAGVSHPTARSWLSVLETSFLVTRLDAWQRTIRKQLVRTPKLHFLDAGLAAYLLGITSAEQLTTHPLRGALFESWVAGELGKLATQRGGFDRFFHYRDAKRLEVDLVIESPDATHLVEAKSGATVASDFFDALRTLGAAMASRDSRAPVLRWVIYGGEARQRRVDCTALPWHQVARVLGGGFEGSAPA